MCASREGAGNTVARAAACVRDRCVPSPDVWSDCSRAEMFAILAQLAKQTVLAYGNESKFSALLIPTQQHSPWPISGSSAFSQSGSGVLSVLCTAVAGRRTSPQACLRNNATRAPG